MYRPGWEGGGRQGSSFRNEFPKIFKFELDDKAIRELKFKKLTLCSRPSPGREQAKAGGAGAATPLHSNAGHLASLPPTEFLNVD